MIRQPQSSYVGTPIGEVQIALQTPDGKIAATATSAVTLSIDNNPNSGTLRGKTTVAAVDGVASFPMLPIDQSGGGYTIRASSGKLTAASSDAIDINPGAAPPEITPGGNDFSGPVWIQMSSTTPGAVIHFTKNGQDPSKNFQRYDGPFLIDQSSTIKAIARRNGVDDSTLSRADIRITGNTPYGLDVRPPIEDLNLPKSLEAKLPATLSEVGIFADRDLTPKPGIIPYGLNSTIWADHAEIQRWVALPVSAKVGFSPDSEFTWPGGTVFIQHFEITTDVIKGDRHRLETRLLALDSAGTFGYGATYRWRDDQSDADLVDEAGDEQVLTITDVSEVGARAERKPSERGLN